MSKRVVRCPDCIKYCNTDEKSTRNKDKHNTNCKIKNKTILLTSSLKNAHRCQSTSGNVPLESSTQQSTNNNNMSYDEQLNIHKPEVIPNNAALQTISTRDLNNDYIIKYKELENIMKYIELQKYEYHRLKIELYKLEPSYRSEIEIKKSKAVTNCLNSYNPRNFCQQQLKLYKTIPPIQFIKPLNHSEDLRIIFCQKIVSLFIAVMAKQNSPNEKFPCNNCCELHVDEKRMLALKSLKNSITGPPLSKSIEMFSSCVKECKEELIDILDKHNTTLDYHLKLSKETKDVLLNKLQIDYQKEIMNNKFEKLAYEIELFSGQKCSTSSYLLSSLIKQRDEYIEYFDQLDHEFNNLNVESNIKNEVKSFNDFLIQQRDAIKESDITSDNKCLSEHKECATQSFISSENLNIDINDNGENYKANEVVSNCKTMIKDFSTLRGETNQSSEDTFDYEELD